MVYRNGQPLITTLQVQSTNITWAEYEALPATKLTDGVYYNITDWEQSTLDIVNTLSGENIALQNRIAELENANTYSTDEVIIGTYNDKPLYRRFFSWKTPNATGWNDSTSLPVLQNITPIKYDGHIYLDDQDYIEPLTAIIVRYKKSSGKFNVNTDQYHTNKDAVLELTYIKTTN